MQGLSRPRQKALVVFRRVKDARAFIVEEHPANVELDRSSLEEVNQNVLIDNGHYREGTTRRYDRVIGLHMFTGGPAGNYVNRQRRETARGKKQKKRVRYLRDTDRRNIIKRIENGEKQTALAREFGVTRAAICHIKKNRFEALLLYNTLMKSTQDI
ncbi:hypothetical protein PC116_g24683 [Phytophthora cactorum]|uniref:Uncharacterized protein n=1 Tax=Phytophthora cactorum TaxID=29920 RepID=A0A329S0L0_9STRA|nr:hypothetical protein PC116_g24683 [Phytophthora cactorum]RAW29078.1 hypothetical protein PC110_g14557 [Phytophthora cactorum]